MAWLLFGLLVVTYLVTAKGFTEITDAENYLTVTRSLVNHGWVDISTDDALTPHTFRATWHVQGPDGRTYSLWGLGYSLAQVPFYAAGKAAAGLAARWLPSIRGLERFLPRAAVSLVGPLATALTALLVFYVLMGMRLTPTWATVGALVYGVGTLAFPYSKIGFYEPFQALCAFATFAAAIHYRRHRQPWAIWVAGFALGWGACTKLVLLPLLVPVGAYLAWVIFAGSAGAAGRGKRYRDIACFLAGVVPWIAVILWYNWVRTGSVWQTGQRAADLVFSAAPGVVVSRFIYYFFSPGSGLFIYSPLLLLFFLGLRPAWRQWKIEVLMGAGIAACLAGPYMLQVNLLDTWSWGPRYMVPLVPLLFILTMLAVVRLWETTRGRRVAAAFVALSIVVQLLAIATPYGNHYRRVRQQYGTVAAIAYQPAAFPLAGQVRSLLQASFKRIVVDRREVASGIIPEHIKSEVRRSLDFWWAYAYRLGLPRGVIIGPLGLLIALVGLFSQQLVATLRRPRVRRPTATAGH